MKNLYLLLEDRTQKLIAYAEEKEIIAKYVNQFRQSKRMGISNPLYRVETLCYPEHKSRIHYITTYYNQMEIQEQFDELYLTELEWEYYKLQFLQMYETIKDTIVGLHIINNISTEKEYKEKINEVRDLSYEKYKTFEDFMETFDRTYIFDKIIVDPIETQQINQEQSELQDRYKYLIEKE